MMRYLWGMLPPKRSAVHLPRPPQPRPAAPCPPTLPPSRRWSLASPRNLRWISSGPRSEWRSWWKLLWLCKMVPWKNLLVCLHVCTSNTEVLLSAHVCKNLGMTKPSMLSGEKCGITCFLKKIFLLHLFLPSGGYNRMNGTLTELFSSLQNSRWVLKCFHSMR